MSRKSNISLSNRALFYPSQKDTFQQHEESRNSNVVKRDLFKQKTANSSFPNLPELGSGWPRRGLRYPRVSVRSHTFEHGEHPNQSKITSVTPPSSPYGASARPLLAQPKGEHRPARVPVGLKLRGNHHGGRAALGFEPLSGVNGTTFRPSEIKDVALIGLAFGQPKRRAQQLLKAKVSITQAKSNQYNLSYLGRVFSSCSTPSGANFRVAKASRPGVAQLAQKNPEQHFGLDPKGATEKCCSRPSEPQVGPEGLEPLWLRSNPRATSSLFGSPSANPRGPRRGPPIWLLRNPRDISVQWLERLGFTFSPFAFIFGTTFFFAALASTLQKQDGKHWLETVSHTKLPGLTENKVSQMSSWVFLESVLSQYINRDNSLLVSTRPLWGRPEPSSGNSLSQDPPYSAKLRETMPQTSTFVHGKPAIGAVQLGGAIEIQLSPIWSHHIKKDFLGVFPSSKRYENFSSAKVKPVLQAPTGPDFASLNPLGLPELRSGNLRSNCSASQSTRTRSEAEHEQEFRSADEARVPAGPRRTTGTGSWSDEESTPFGFVRSSKRSLNKSKTGRLACLGNLRRSFVKPAQSVYVPGAPRMGANSSEALAGLARYASTRPAVAELQKTLIWPWYQIMAYHSPNHLILPTWGDETIIKDKVSLRGNSLVPTPGTTPRLSPDRVNRAELGWPEGPQNNFDTSVERLRLEDDSIPSKKDSIYSKKEIHQDSLSARVLNVVKKSFYDYGLSIPGSAQPPILDRSGRAELLLQAPTGPDFASLNPLGLPELRSGNLRSNCSASQNTRSKEERGFPTQSSRSRRSENFSEAKGKPVLGRAHPLAEQEGAQHELRSAKEGLDKLVKSKNENFSLFGKDSVNGQYLAPSSLSSRDENFSSAKGKPVLGRAHPLADQEGGQQELRSASRPSGALAGLARYASTRPALASEGLESKRNRNEVPAFVRSLNKSEVLGKSMQSSCQAKPNLDGVLNVSVPANSSEALAGLARCASTRPAVAATYTDQPEALRETNNSSEAGRRRGQVIGSSENSSKPPLLSSTKSSGLALIFRNTAIPKKSFWEYAHSISGYNFPELQDDEVADLLGKVSASTQSKVGLVTLLSEASRRHGKFGKAGKLALTPQVNSDLRLDTGRVLLAPYLAKVPPKVILAASTEQAKLRLPETFVEVGSNAKADRNSCWAVLSQRLSKKGPSTWRTQPSATLRSKVWPSPFWASAGLQPARVPVGRRGLEQEVARIAMGKVDRRHEQPLAKDFTIRYTPLQLEHENKVKKAFKELGRDYSDYLKQPKDSLPALLLSPSLEEDKQIEQEEIQRVAQEKAAAKAAAKRTQNEEEYNRNDSVANEEEFTITDLDPSAQTELRSAIEIALREGKNSSSNLEEEPLNDEEIEDSRFERLRFTREVETKKKEEDCRGLALSLPCRDSNAPMAGLIGARQPGLNKINDKLTVGQVLALCSLREQGQQELRSSCSPYGASKRSNDLVPKEPNEAPKGPPTGPTNLVATQPKGDFVALWFAFGEPKVSDRKHSFFGQRSFWPTRLFSQEERLVSAHTVNPYILYDQSNPWLIPKQGGGLPVTSQTKPSANCPTSCSTLMSTGPTNRDGGQLLDLRSKVCKTDDLQNLKNLQAQARLGLVRFVHLPMVEGALVYVPATAGRVLATRARPARASLASAPRLPELRSGSPQRGVAEGSSCWAVLSQRLSKKGVSTGLPLASLKFSERLGTPATYTPKAGSQNRIYKPDPRLRLTSLESSISADWRDDRKVEASPFRVTSKERPYIVLPQLSEKEWQKSLEWQLKRHFLDEDTRLESLVATEPYKTFKVKRIDRSLPWLTLEKPSFKLFQWPYKPVGVFPLLNPSVPCSISLLGLERAELERSSCWPCSCSCSASCSASLSKKLSTSKKLSRREHKASSCPIPLASSFTTYSKDRSALSVGSNPLFYVTKKLFVSQPNVNTELLFEPPSTSSWFLIYRLFLALILKEVFKYIYRVSLKDFFIRIINSDFGRTITSPEFRQSVQFEPFPEFYRPKNRLKDLIGIRNALLPLSEIIWFLRNNCRSRNGPHGVILLGPEGVDTTAIARAVAGEAKVPIIVQSLRALTLTHSHPQKRLEKVLLLARAQSPCVLFLDELDVIGQSREGVIRNTSGDGNSLISLDSNQFTDGEPQLQLPDEQATSQGRRVDLMLRLLTVMDGLHHLNGVVIITTSKNTATLDPALLRPGRFDRLIHLRLPNHDDRMELFQAKTSGRAELLLSEADHGRLASRLGQTDQMSLDERSSLLSVAELEYLSHRTENMGGADIVSAINYSTLRAIVNDTVHTVETLEYGLNCVKALKEKQGRLRRS